MQLAKNGNNMGRERLFELLRQLNAAEASQLAKTADEPPDVTWDHLNHLKRVAVASLQAGR